MTPEILSSLGNHLWQSTVFAGAVALMALALKNNRAAVRYRLWLVASVKFLLPFSLLISLGSYVGWSADPVDAPAALVTAVEGFSEPFNTERAVGPSANTWPAAESPSLLVSRLPALMFVVWLGGAGLVALAWFREWRRLRIVLNTAVPAEMGFPIPVLMTVRPIEPGIVGILRPMLLLPKGLIDRMTPAQFGILVAHELCHVRRRDNLTAALHMVVEMAFWFHPLVWWIERRLVEERERACDEAVLDLGGEPQTYAEGILNVCRFCKESALMCVSGVAGGNLKTRIEDIMRSRIGQRLNVARKATLAAAAIAALAVPIAVGGIASPSTVAAGQFSVEPHDHSPEAAAQPAAAARLTPQSSIGLDTSAAGSRPANQRPPAAQNVAQSAPATASQFEEASIRPCDPENIPPAPSGGRGGGSGPNGFQMTPGRTHVLCMTLATIIRHAYGYGSADLDSLNEGARGRGMGLDHVYALGVEDGKRVRGGPDWVRTERYTIDAVADAAADAATMSGPMLRALLERRFQLKAHIESEPAPALALTVAEGGLKLKPVEAGACTPMNVTPGVPAAERFRSLADLRRGEKPTCGLYGGVNGPNNVWVGGEQTLSTLARSLGSVTFSPLGGGIVIDKTGITDKFNFLLEFVRDENTPGSRLAFPPASEPPDVPRAPTLFVALQEQLGLKLEPARVLREFIVIDRVERPSPD